MISTFFLSIFNGFVNLLVGFLHTGHLPAAIGSAFTYFASLLNLFSYIVPVDTMLQAAVLILSVDAAVMLWHFINWIIRKIPGMQ